MHGNELFLQGHSTPIEVVILCPLQRVVNPLRPKSLQIQDRCRRFFCKFTYERIRGGLTIFDPSAGQPELRIA